MVEWLWRIAIHESGHAVIARVLELRCSGETTIIPSRPSSAGHSFRVDFDDDEIGSFIMGLFAGGLAEEEFFGELAGADCTDRRDWLYIVSAAQYHPLGFDCLPKLRPACKRLVREHRTKIEAVANALLQRKTLTVAEVDAVMGT